MCFLMQDITNVWGIQIIPMHFFSISLLTQVDKIIFFLLLTHLLQIYSTDNALSVSPNLSPAACFALCSFKSEAMG